ncbi:FGGY-family carbohydrate kinase [Faecalicatena contorta]|uniref:Xylulokinase n=1 Tax=Faecalicatena contorta TaxID=39482 RepID=A0A315ZQ76_9FIRM|nr:FGGY-family carbohydrate kinase [Faecalicatena contorta]PWJ47140.1 xylulokinase [Faecalicatena contorta]SUQ16115.1 xylulokinase [Faecalicatena contorta]
MSNHIFIGCDIGTSGTKAVAADSSGNILAQAAETYSIIQLHNNWAEQEPDVWLEAAVSTLRSVIEQLPSGTDISSICISALYGGTGVMCDEHMNSIRPPLIWMDRRAEQESSHIRSTLGEELLFKTTGNGIDSYFGFTKLLWVQKNEPENWAKIKHILPIHSYIIYKMTGQLCVDYCSAGNMGGIYDQHTHSWSEEMCSKLNIPYSALPSDFHNPSDVIGMLNKDFQRKLGLDHPVAMCTGTVDCIASMLSAGIVHPGDNAAVLGTSLNWGLVHGDKLKDPTLVSMPYCITPRQLNYTYGGASTAGALPRWFAAQFMDSDSLLAYQELEASIARQNIAPGAEGLVLLPYFMGERTPIWDENATGVLFGLTLSHTKAHIYRAVLESVAYSLLHIIESMTGGSLAVQKIVLVGGGARSELWKQIFADVTGLPVYTPIQDIEAPLGDAFLAAVGSGSIREYSVIESWITMKPAVLPNKQHHLAYKEYFELYKELYLKLKETMSKRAGMLKPDLPQ